MRGEAESEVRRTILVLTAVTIRASGLTCEARPLIPLQDVIPSRAVPIVTLSLIAANALAFGVERWADGGQAGAWLAAAGPMFFHPAVLALVINLLYLWLFGDNVENRLGRIRFAMLYIISGIAAAITQSVSGLDERGLPVGASGAIGGVLGAYFFLFPRSRVLTLVPVPLSLHEVPAVFYLLLWYMFQILILAAIPATRAIDQLIPSVLAHGSAFAMGTLLGVALGRRERTRVEWWGK